MSKILTTAIAEAPTRRATAGRARDERMPSREKLFLGIDGGGTKTHAVITDSSFRVLGEGFSGAGNPLRVGLEEAVLHVEEAVSGACEQVGIELEDVDSACA